MSAPDIGGSYSQIAGGSSVQPVTGPTSTAGPKAKIGFSSQDSISASELAALAMMLTSNAQYPILFPPADPNNVGSIGSVQNGSSIVQLSNQYHKACMSVLDSWSESIQKQADAAKAFEKSPAHLAKIDATRKDNLRLLDSVKDYADQMKTDGQTQGLGALTGALMITGAFLGVIATGIVVASTKFIESVSPQVNFAVNLATQATANLSDDFRAQLGLIGAWAMGSLMNFSTIETIADKQSGKAVDDKLLAEKYGLKTMELINSNQLNLFIEGMLANRTENGKPITEERKSELSAVLKLIMLGSALAAIYKSKTGKITGQEFSDLINGKMKPDGDLEKQIVATIKDLIEQLNPSEKDKVLYALADYMESDPKLKNFFDVGNTFDDVNETLAQGPDVSKA